MDKGLARVSAGEKRVALVIGNKDYADKPLQNPLNDAFDMKAALESLGFTVIYRENADLAQMDEAMHEFARQLDKNSVGLFYYSGHGLQADGINYLVPVGASIASKAEVKSRAYDANIVLGSMEEAGARVGVVVLDACRNSPLRGFRSTAGGLAQMGGGSGSIIAFATAPGETAEDGKGRNGTFTRHLLAHLHDPGLSAIDALRQVQTEVAEATGNSQNPWINFGPQRGQFCFASCEAKPQAVAADPRLQEQSFWDDIKHSQDPADFKAYLEQYPGGRHAGLAGNRLKRLDAAPAAASKPAHRPAAQHLAPPPVAESAAPPTALSETIEAFGIAMLKIPEGVFGIGPDESGKPRRNVKVRAFKLGKTELTQGQWKAVVGANPSYFEHCGDDCPVENVSFHDVQEFIHKLNAKTGQHYRLPTEAEWEYACRAGGDARYCGGDDVDAVAWYGENSSKATHPVGQKQANAWGLHDMSGNVWEWTCSAYTSGYGDEAACAGAGDRRRVVRGGAWGGEAQDMRSTRRNPFDPANQYVGLGFRLAQD